MADKVSAGQPIPRSAALWNNIIGSANDYAAKQLGQPGQRSPVTVPTDIIKIKNSSGSHIRLGYALEISGFLLSSVRRDAMWFDGATPNATRPIAIALQDIPTGSIDRAQVSGVCPAWVHVTDAAHKYALALTGDLLLHSGTAGPLKILYKPGSTGEMICAVLFTPDSVVTQLKTKCRFTLDAALATTDESKAATIQQQFGYGTDHASTSITVYNFLTHTANTYLYEGDSGDAGRAFYDPGGGKWYIDEMECP